MRARTMPAAITSKGVDAMGRGRQRAKQAKVARQLKYFSPDTDYQALERELAGKPAKDDPYEDPYADQYDDEDDEDEDYHGLIPSATDEDDWGRRPNRR
ncbi:MAG TPA: DUF3073 domain-containing protein [Actinomycetaceae bacterium]|nr:DUF3073 domain-containing protein [Actinomycetaceae bacterium]